MKQRINIILSIAVTVLLVPTEIWYWIRHVHPFFKTSPHLYTLLAVLFVLIPIITLAEIWSVDGCDPRENGN